jgi:hypothetical protein
MGWSSGSNIFEEIITVLRSNVPNYEDRCDIYRELISVFENYDCDTLYECVGSDEAFDEVWKEMYPDDDYED